MVSPSPLMLITGRLSPVPGSWNGPETHPLYRGRVGNYGDGLSTGVFSARTRHTAHYGRTLAPGSPPSLLLGSGFSLLRNSASTMPRVLSSASLFAYPEVGHGCPMPALVQSLLFLRPFLLMRPWPLSLSTHPPAFRSPAPVLFRVTCLVPALPLIRCPCMRY